jgi:hypothetical protein
MHYLSTILSGISFLTMTDGTQQNVHVLFTKMAVTKNQRVFIVRSLVSYNISYCTFDIRSNVLHLSFNSASTQLAIASRHPLRQSVPRK